MKSILLRLQRLIGNTPLKCFRLEGGRTVCVKLEYVNPTGSHKDRIAFYMVREAVEEGASCVVEASSGNTAVSVAWVASQLGLNPILVVNPRASPVKKNLVRLLGGKLVEAYYGVEVEVAKRIAAEKGCVYLNQHANEANFRAHYEWTGGEIVEQLSGVDVFVMGIGTGGTITGVAARLRDEGIRPRVVGVTPKGSRVAGGSGGDHIEGLSSKTVPELYTRHSSLVDSVVEVSVDNALEGVKMLYRDTGILAGPSTGAAYFTLKRILLDMEAGSIGLIIAADHLQRYPDVLEKLVHH